MPARQGCPERRPQAIPTSCTNPRASSARSYPGMEAACLAKEAPSVPRPSAIARRALLARIEKRLWADSISSEIVNRQTASGAAKRPDVIGQASSQTRTVLSSLPERAKRPSELNATDLITPVCPPNVRRHTPDAASHRRTVLSAPPESAIRPSALSATVCTRLEWPSKLRRQSPVSVFHK